MEKISLKEFQNYCKRQGFSSYLYTSDNQPYRPEEYSQTTLIFNNIHISLFPKMILFTHNNHRMQLNCVKQIMISEDCAIGVVCTIVCGYNDDKINQKTYTFIAK